MSFELLRSLYGGRGTNADLVTTADLSRLHVETPLEAFVPSLVARGVDVVLTGNPGDGKSHAVRLLQGQDKLRDAVVESDLSAHDSGDVARAWAAAAGARRPFVLCGNEGPLLELLSIAEQTPALADRARELRAQVGRLTVARADELPAEPRHAVLIDLADRNLLVEANVERALTRVCNVAFLPTELGIRASESSTGRNILLLAGSAIARRRLARVLSIAGRRRGGHFTFRQLWQAIAYALTGGKGVQTLLNDLYSGNVGLGTYPLDHLTRGVGRGFGRGPLIEAVRDFADPATVTDPDLDEALWAGGVNALGQLDKEAPIDVPSQLWDSDKKAALQVHAQLKRYVALTHPRCEFLMDRLAGGNDLPSNHSDEQLLSLTLEGIRRMYTPPGADEQLPAWLLSGLPLWIGHSYAEVPTGRRPHVAVGCRAQDEFEVLRPRRVTWLDGVLGPLPDEAWISHRLSGAMLRVDPEALADFERAPHTTGPMRVPERVTRFLARLAGWEERNAAERAGWSGFAVLSRPRGELVCHGTVAESAGGASYA